MNTLYNVHPTLKAKFDELVDKALDAGIKVIVLCGWRSFDEQNVLYSQGRTTPGKIVTNAKAWQSYHNYGLAIDFGVMVDGKLVWDVNLYEKVGAIAESLGMEWGGSWHSFKDYGHLQMTMGISLKGL